jgi:AcrR family transcriptional regulator
VAEPNGGRRREIGRVATRILEAEGREALTMRRLASEIGIQAPSLYKHVRDKAELEAILIAEGFRDFAAELDAAVTDVPDDLRLARLAIAYREFARRRPHLYRLLTSGELPRDRLPEGVEASAAAPLLATMRDPDAARAVWAFAHGMTILELDGRFPPDADLDAAWRAGLAAFERR